MALGQVLHRNRESIAAQSLHLRGVLSIEIARLVDDRRICLLEMRGELREYLWRDLLRLF
jgi:hypothetical protein